MLYDEGHKRLWEPNTSDKTRCGERGRGQMILPVAKEDTAATRQYMSISGEAGDGVDVLIVIRPSSHRLPPLAKVQLSLRNWLQAISTASMQLK